MNDHLVGKEKMIVWIANLVNPFLAGFLFYYVWRKNFPMKAKQANNVSFIVFIVYLVGYLAYKVAGGSG